MRRIPLLIALVVLAACSSPDTGAPDPATTATPSTTTPAPTAAEPLPSIEGLLLVESDSGDVYHYELGSWNLRYDGPSYDDESATTFAESAAAAAGRVIVGVCCEPVIGALLAVQPDSGEAVYSGYGTRPARVGSRVVTFRVEYLDAESAPKVSLLVAEGFASEGQVEYEMELGNFHPGSRLVALDDRTVAFIRSESGDAASPRQLMVVDIEDRNGRGYVAEVPLPQGAELAASESGELYVFASSGNDTGLYLLSAAASSQEWVLSSDPFVSLPAGTFAVAVRGSTVIAAADVLLASTGGEFSVIRDHPPVWVGW